MAEGVQIIYGGSVSPTNAAKFLSRASVDGLLVGTASTEFGSFKQILAAADGL